MSVHTIDITEATHPLADYLQQIETEPTVVMREGQPVAVVASIDDVDMESLSLSANPQFRAIIERARAAHTPGTGLSSDEVRKRLGIG
jgi:PHD/YefM family antitoxin component YafN of YafNO toxin-antitoxin module